jgi:hypothetical protein
MSQIMSTKKFVPVCASTLKGSRTPAACLEGKHDNRFTISVDDAKQGINITNISVRFN